QTKEKLANIAKVKKDQKSDLEDSVKSVEKEKENLKDKKASYVKEGNDIEALEEKVNAIKQAKEEKEANQESGKQEAEKDTQAETQEKDVKIEQTSTKNSNNEKTKDVKTKEKKETNKHSIKEITMSATGYTAKCTGCSGITATGIDLNKNPNAKVVAVDPSVIPLGSRVWVSGYGEAIAGDTGGAIKGNRIDLHFP